MAETKARQTKIQHVQSVLDEADPLNFANLLVDKTEYAHVQLLVVVGP